MFLSIQWFLLCVYYLIILSSNLLPFMHEVFPPVLYFYFAHGLSAHIPLISRILTLRFWLKNYPLLWSFSAHALSVVPGFSNSGKFGPTVSVPLFPTLDTLLDIDVGHTAFSSICSWETLTSLLIGFSHFFLLMSFCFHSWLLCLPQRTGSYSANLIYPASYESFLKH